MENSRPVYQKRNGLLTKLDLCTRLAGPNAFAEGGFRRADVAEGEPASKAVQINEEPVLSLSAGNLTLP